LFFFCGVWWWFGLVWLIDWFGLVDWLVWLIGWFG